MIRIPVHLINGALLKPGMRAVTVLLAAALLLAGCAPGSVARESTEGARPPATSVKTLVIAHNDEAQPNRGFYFIGLNDKSGSQVYYSLHTGLTVYDQVGQLVPRIAQRVPTVENGDWKVFPDGRMEVTWKLRPNVLWHDGVPLTAEDYVFGMRVLMDNDVPMVRPSYAALISEVTAPDSQTLVVAWKGTHILGNEGGPMEFVTLPRRLLAEVYENGDKQALTNNPYFTARFVGLGPYSLESWEYGSHIEMRAFDQYFLGRPKIDRMILRYFGDPNATLAALLAGEVDMIGFGPFKSPSIRTLKAEWETPGRGSILGVINGVRNLRIQFRDPEAPWAKDVRVRQALALSLDRQTLVDAMSAGTVPVAHTLPGPDEPVYQVLQQKGFTPYPFDSRRAQALLAEAGWTKGADGLYRSGTGSVFSISVSSQDKTDNMLETEAIVGLLREPGLNPSSSYYCDGCADKDRLQAQFTGLLNRTLSSAIPAMKHLTTSEFPAEQGRWRGANSGVYANPSFDQLYERYVSTLQPAARDDLLAQMLKTEADDVATIYMYYDMSTAVAVIPRGLTGPGPVPPNQLAPAWNVHTWDHVK